MKVSVQLFYSHGYFVRFPHTGADVITHLLFVFSHGNNSTMKLQ